MFDYRPQELLGQPIARVFPTSYCQEFLQDVRGHDTPPHLRVVGARRHTDGLKKQGATFPIEVAISKASACGRRFYTGVVRDLTEQRQLERQLVQSQKLEAVGLLAGGIAHEFNNSLQVIQGFAEYVQEGLPQHDVRFQDLEQVIKAAKRSAKLTRQLLTFSRHDLLEPVSVDPAAVVSELAEMLRPVIGKRIDFQVNSSTDVGTLQADPAMIKQVLTNLCINARDAMPSGGCLTLETRRVELSPKDCELHAPAMPGPYVMFSVSDTGCGIPPHVRDRMFEPFFTTKEVGQGTGLGLSMVYGAIRQHDGIIDVESTVAVGTTFRIYLPIAGIEAPDARHGQFS